MGMSKKVYLKNSLSKLPWKQVWRTRRSKSRRKRSNRWVKKRWF